MPLSFCPGRPHFWVQIDGSSGCNQKKQEQVVQAKTAGRMRDPFLTDLNKINDEEDFKETLRFACQ